MVWSSTDSICNDTFFVVGFLFFKLQIQLLLGPSLLSISCLISFGGLRLSRDFSISSEWSYLLTHNCSEYSFIIICISVRSVIMSSLSFLIWLISVFFFVNIAISLSILLIFSKNQVLISLIFLYFPLSNFINLHFIISFLCMFYI